MMLRHGSAIAAAQLERIIGASCTPAEFAALCNAVAWSIVGRRASTLPSFTERVNVADNGIDAEWDGDMPADPPPSALLSPGWNVYQYKQRDIAASNRRTLVSNLVANMKGALKELHKRAKRRPSRYVAFTNIHLTPAEKKRLKGAILDEYDEPTAVQVEIIGAAELAALLNDVPHLRSAYFATDAFCTWEEGRRRHERQLALVAHLPLVGRAGLLAELRSAVDDPDVRAIVITGPQGMGKTRLALEATAHRPVETILALDPRSMSRKDLLALAPRSGESVVIVEDPDSERVEAFVQEALAGERLKLLISLPTAEHTPTPGFGRDQRVRTIALQPLSASDATELLDQANRGLDYGLRNWIVEQAGGNPGLLLHAASLGPELVREPSLLEAMAPVMERWLRAQLAPADFEVLQLLGLMTFVGLRRDAAIELEALCRLFGNGLTPNDALNALPRLEEAGVVRAAGSYAEVTPPLLANHLATGVLRARSGELLALVANLRSAARDRLLRRLLAVRGDDAERFWREYVDGLFGDGGALSALPDALAHGRLLHLAAQVSPERIATFIEERLGQLAPHERATIARSERDELERILDELRFRRRSAASAIRCLALLAEGQARDSREGAAQDLAESFFPLHPQLPLPLDRRLEILREFASPNATPGQRSLAVRVIRRTLGGMHGVVLRGDSSRPPDVPPETMWRDVFAYLASLLDLLLELAMAPEPALAEEARASLPGALAQYAIDVPPWADDAVARIESVTDGIAAGTLSISVPIFSDAVRRVRLNYERHSHQAGAPDDSSLRGDIERLDFLLERLDGLPDPGDFAARLRRWINEAHVGPGSWERRVTMLQTLAAEAVTERTLDPDTLTWLCSGEAKYAPEFFQRLGAADTELIYRDDIVSFGRTRPGMWPFIQYFRSVDVARRADVEALLDELADEGGDLGVAVALATAYCCSPTGIARIGRQIQERLVRPQDIGGVLDSVAWLKELPADDFLRLLMVVARPQLATSTIAIRALQNWCFLYDKEAIKGALAEFAWQSLEALPPVGGGDGLYDANEIGAALVDADPERGFRLLDRLLSQPYKSHAWNPLDDMSDRTFWHALASRDRERALRIALGHAASGSAYLDTYLCEAIDQIADADLLAVFAAEDEAHAELVGKIITAAFPGFWPIAFKILGLSWPGSLSVWRYAALA